MGQIEVEAKVARPADEVWKLVGDFGGIDAWFPGIESCEVDGDIRTLQAQAGTIKEKLLEQDDAERRQSYTIVEFPTPLEGHKATLQVHEDGEGSVVTYDVEAPDAAIAFMEPIYQQAVQTIKEKAEA